MGTTIGSLDRSDGLEAVVGVLARITRGDAGPSAISSSSSTAFSYSMRLLPINDVYMKCDDYHAG